MADGKLVKTTSDGQDMRECVGRRSGSRCTPQLTAAQHMQAGVA